jgi:hypothetical protein
VKNGAEAVLVAEIMPAQWARFLRNAPPEATQLRPYARPSA